LLKNIHFTFLFVIFIQVFPGTKKLKYIIKNLEFVTKETVSYKNYLLNYNDILNGAKIGFEFEFCSKLDPLFMVRSISDILHEEKIRVVLPLNVDSLNKPAKPQYHSNVSVSESIAKLEVDRSGGSKCYELITGPIPYKTARLVLIKVFNWIKKNAWTTDRCSVHANISFDEYKVETKIDIVHLNVLKFCLEFDEDTIYKKFPNRKSSIYANSIKKLLLGNIFSTNSRNNQILVPNEKYYGVNFQKMKDNYLEFRYLGSKDYEQRSTDFLDMIDYFISFTYKQLMNPELSSKNLEQLKDNVEYHKKILEVYKDPMLFNMNFPNIGLLVNLNDNIEVIKTFWTTIQDKVLEALLKGGIKKATLNYDSDTSTMQIRKGNFDFCYGLTGWDLVECEGSGYFTQCRLIECNLKNTILTSCWLISENTIESSKILDCMVGEDNSVKNCYIESKTNESVFAGSTEKSIFRSGVIHPDAKISADTDVIEKTDYIAPKRKNYGTFMNVDPQQYKERKLLKPQK